MKLIKLTKPKTNSGQSLLEILIGLGIGGVLIGAASMGIAFMLRTSVASQNLQKGSAFASSLSNKVTSWANADWQNIYGLTKGATAQCYYFLNASGTGYFAVQGAEGVVDGDIVNGLIGHWGFDEASGVNAYDGSGNNDNGVIGGTISRATSTCIISNCLNFDGTTNYVSVNNAPPLDISQTITLAAWVKPGSGNAYPNRIIDKGDDTQPILWEYSLMMAGPQDVEFSINSAGSITELTTNTNVLKIGQWSYVVGVYDGAKMYIYVNGALVASTAKTGAIKTSSQRLVFGARSTDFGQKFIGALDDIRIYNRALSVSEVSTLYHAVPFTRYFTVQDVCRTNDASSSIVGLAPCGVGTVLDPSTEQVAVYTSWLPNNSGSPQIQLINYLTRWQNQTFIQADWSGGAGQNGPFTTPGRFYSTSTNVDVTSSPGSIKILNLSP